MTVGEAARQALEHYKQKDTSKGEPTTTLTGLFNHTRHRDYPANHTLSPVVVRFKSIGAAPIMKNNVFKITAGNKFQAVIVFLRGQLGLKESDPLVSPVMHWNGWMLWLCGYGWGDGMSSGMVRRWTVS